MTTVTRIVEHVVDPSPSLAVEVVAARRAVDACGYWPSSATLGELMAAVIRADRALERIETIWARYSRRHHLPSAEIDAAPVRLQVRYQIVRQIHEQRRECYHMLTGPSGGSA